MRPTGKMHSASLEGSPRLQGLLAYLESVGAQGATAGDVRRGTAPPVEAVSAAVDELRDNGVDIICVPWNRGGPRKQWTYWLRKHAPKEVLERVEAGAIKGMVQGDLFGETG